MKRRCIPAAVMMCCAAMSLYAQVLPFRTYSTREGLPSNNIRALHQDDRNRLWVGTDNGIAIYDGRTWKILSMVDGLPSNIINDLAPSARHPDAVWIGTIGGGVARYADGRCTTIVPGVDDADRIVLSLVETDDGRLWISTMSGVKVLEADTIRWLRHTTRPADGTVLRRSDTDLVLARGDSILRLDVATSSVRGVRVRKGATLSVLTVLPSGDTWTGESDSTVYRLHDTSVVWRGKLPDRPADFVMETDGSLWISGEYSLMRLPPGAPEALERYTERNGLPPYITGPVLLDREGSLWIGTWFAGLLKLSSRTYRSVPFGQRISNAVCDSAMRFWAGTEDGLLEATPDNGGRWGLRKFNGGLLGCGSAPAPQLVDGRGRLWVASSTQKELFCYDVASPLRERPRLLRQFDMERDFRSQAVMRVFEDRKKRIWISLVEVGLAILDGATLRTRQLIPRNGTVLRDSRVIYEDARGRFWVGDFSGGLSLLENGPGDSVRLVRTFTTADGLPHDGVRSLAEDPDGRLWIGTRLGGITRFDGERWVTISQKDGLRSNAGWAVVVQNRERVWAGTDFGVEGIDPRTMRPFPTLGEMQGERILRMGIVADSVLWAATAYAIHLHDMRGEVANAIPPPVFITSFLVNGEPQPIRSGQTFAYDRNTAAIEYIGVSLKDEEAVRYEYRLGGDDAPWHTTGAQHAVTLAGLPPAGYTFAVRARNGDGTWSATPAVLSFTITPPFWRTWWFMSAIGIGAIGSVVLLVRRRLRALEHARRQQEEFSRRLIDSQEQERKRIAAELHDSLGQSLLIIKNKAELGVAGPAGTAGHLQDISDIASRSVAEIREIAHDLRPYLVDKLGLTKGLRSMVRRLADSSGIAFVAEIAEIDGFFPPEQEISFYRIIQEATNNVVKHSRAAECLVTVERSDGGLTAVVADDGVGIAASEEPPAENRGGFGLVGISERVRLLAGTWRIERRPEGGTVLTVRIPSVEKT